MSESDLYAPILIAHSHGDWRKRQVGTVRCCAKCRAEFVVTSDCSYCRQCRREYSRAWSKRNSHSERERAAAYREKNRDAQRVRSRKCMARLRATDPDYARRIKEWRAANKDGVRIWDIKKVAKRKLAPIGNFILRDWKQLKSIWGNRCAYCGKSSERLTKDHMVPLARGGIHDVSNIVPACLSCNTSKCARTVEEYYEWRAKRTYIRLS
jgi:HNH endonuclease